MIVTFLGTGTSQGVPMIGCNCEVCTSKDEKDKRLRTSILVTNGNKNVVIDTGPDFRQQMIRQDIRQLSAVVFTHEHKDHIAGMDDIRAFNYLQGEEMDLYATDRVQSALKREFPYVFDNSDYPGIPKAKLHTINASEPFELIGLKFVPIKLLHMNLPVTGFRINDFTYITDANSIPGSENNKIRGSKVIVINALREKKHVSHFSLSEAVELLEEFKPEKGYLIHLSHQMGKHADVNKRLPAFIECAYDGLTINA